MTRGNLERRIRRLEVIAAPRASRSPLVVCIGLGEKQPGPQQCVVTDYFRDAGIILWARDRISACSEAADRHCAPGGYLLDVLEKIHATCHWREVLGACQLCQGTPVANKGAEGAEENQEDEEDPDDPT